MNKVDKLKTPEVIRYLSERNRIGGIASAKALTVEERRERARKGGLASQKARREGKYNNHPKRKAKAS